jgi:hypothetical protein
MWAICLLEHKSFVLVVLPKTHALFCKCLRQQRTVTTLECLLSGYNQDYYVFWLMVAWVKSRLVETN